MKLNIIFLNKHLQLTFVIRICSIIIVYSSEQILFYEHHENSPPCRNKYNNNYLIYLFV